MHPKGVPGEYQDVVPELAKVVDAWPGLPGKVKADILAMVEAAL